MTLYFFKIHIYSPYKGNALVLASLVSQQLLGEQVSILREQPAELFLADTLQSKPKKGERARQIGAATLPTEYIFTDGGRVHPPVERFRHKDLCP